MKLILAISCALLWAGVAHAEDRPFKGRIHGSFVSAPTSDPAIFLGGARAAGYATHVGVFTKVTRDIVNMGTGEVKGAFTMTSENGEQLNGVYSGFLTFGTAPGSFSWSLNATITGGTGRFLQATGEFVFIAEGQAAIIDGVAYGEYAETFDGTIRY